MRILLIFSLLFSIFFSSAQETAHIISHNQELIVTNPAKGKKSHINQVRFPSKDKEVRQIFLNLTFECPDKKRCADWDYVDRILITPKNDSITYEVARMLTPYGGRFQEDWRFQWRLDVTDFSQVLRDSVAVNYVHWGYEDNKTRGWKVTVDFEFTYGSPVMDPVAIHKIYDGNYDYGNSKNPIEKHLKPLQFTANSKTAFAKIKVQQTGHGMDANGCGEFCDKYREILFNNKVINKKQLWTKCGDNPLYPQAGTWIFDRANWCPGYLLQPDQVLTAAKPAKPYTVDLNMEPYNTEKPSAKELIVAYVIEYGAINALNDVTLLDIVSPSTEDRFSRKNPNGGYPIIRIKNNGKNPLKKLAIRYYLEGQKPKTFQWTGEIPFSETAMVALPSSIFSLDKEAKFMVELRRPNGKKDAFKADNKKTAIYKRPAMLPQDIVIQFKTNAKAKENFYKISNASGEIVFKKDSLQLENNTLYLDTLHLAKGNYTFNLEDRAGDGLEFWYKTKAGRGHIKILDTLGQAIKQFKSDFGNGIQYHFAVHPEADYELDPKASIAMFPSRTDGPLTLDYFSNTAAEVKVIIVAQEDENEIAEEHIYYNFKQGYLNYDLSNCPKQRYYLKVFVNGKEEFKNRIRLKE